MSSVEMLGLVVFVVCMVGASGYQCPDRCQCNGHSLTHDRVSAKCGGVDSIPRFSAKVKWGIIAISGNSELREVPTDSFYGLNVIGLELDNNRINRISAYAFRGVKGLEVLDLQNNALTKLDRDMFYGLGELTELKLQNNHISYIDNQAFSSLTNLTELILTNNVITSVPTVALRFLAKLESLHLQNNKINKVGAWAFDNLKLRTIDLSHNNKPLHLDSRAFCGMEPKYGKSGELMIQEYALQVVGLSDNGLKTISPCGNNIINTFRLNFANNPVHCDCDMIFIRDMGHVNKKGLNEALCTSPRRYVGKTVGDLVSSDLQCDATLTLKKHDCLNATDFCQRVANPRYGFMNSQSPLVASYMLAIAIAVCKWVVH